MNAYGSTNQMAQQDSFILSRPSNTGLYLKEERYYSLRQPSTCFNRLRFTTYLLAKWQAVKTFDELRGWPAEGQFDLPVDPVDGPVTLYLGQDGESFYLDRAARELRGLLKDSRVCEADLASFAFPVAQPFLPLKFAPKRSSRLCNNNESRKDKEKPGD